MSVIHEAPEFTIYHGMGNEFMYLSTFSPGRVDGSSKNDTMSFSDRECVLVGYNSGERIVHPPWTDIGKGMALAGPKALLWDGPYQYWCISDPSRPNNVWELRGQIKKGLAGASQGFAASAGDYIAVLQGDVQLNGIQHTNFSIIKYDTNTAVEAEVVTDAVIALIRPRPQT